MHVGASEAARECSLRGKNAFVAGCMKLLGGGDADAELILVLGPGSALGCDPPASALPMSEPGGHHEKEPQALCAVA